jgi:hypothetical protein
MTRPTTKPLSAADPATLRATAAERGLSVSEYVLEVRRRAEREAAWEQAMAELEEPLVRWPGTFAGYGASGARSGRA